MPKPPAETGGRAVPYVMNERDVLLGFVFATPSHAPGPLSPSGPSPRAVLEAVLADALAHPPCLVSFSGGRDSSALLAAALDVARRHGLPEPVAFTRRYPGVADADETSWQNLVVGHLRPATWQVVELDHGSAAYLGPAASCSLEAHGLVWPPALHLHAGWLDRARDATIITGEGGDEVLGPHRATPLRTLAHVLRHQPRALDLSLVRRAVKGVAPAPVRAFASRRKMSTSGDLAWVGSPYRDVALTDIARWTTHEPWSWADAIRSHLTLPALELALANRDWLGSAYDVRFVHPLLDPRFVDAVARQGGPLGYAGRTDAMRRIFGDLLPDPILARATKVAFNTAFHGQATRAFAQGWDGTGLDPALVDVDLLRSMWLSERVHAGTDALLQKAWLASGCPPFESSTME